MKKTSYYIEGIKAGLPVLFGFIPIGISYAITAQHYDFSVVEIISMSLIVFAGASQFMAIEMFYQNATAITIIMATFILNFRHFIMSTCIINKMKSEKLLKKIFASFFVTDESFAIYTLASDKKARYSYYCGIITVTYLSWVLGAILGCITAQLLPKIVSDSLGIALYALFIGLIIPSLHENKKLILVIVVTAIISTVLNFISSSGWNVIISTLLGAIFGTGFIKIGDDEK